jgi:hypothetical protein
MFVKTGGKRTVGEQGGDGWLTVTMPARTMKSEDRTRIIRDGTGGIRSSRRETRRCAVWAMEKKVGGRKMTMRADERKWLLVLNSKVMPYII